MEPIDIIVAALVAGAAAGLSETAQQSIKDAYAGLKDLIQRRYTNIDVGMLESNPESKHRQGVTRENLESTNAAQDQDLIERAKALLILLQEHTPDALAKVRIDLGNTEVGNSFRINNLNTVNGGEIDLSAKHLKVDGDFEIGGISAGSQVPPKDQGQ